MSGETVENTDGCGETVGDVNVCGQGEGVSAVLVLGRALSVDVAAGCVQGGGVGCSADHTALCLEAHGVTALLMLHGAEMSRGDRGAEAEGFAEGAVRSPPSPLGRSAGGAAGEATAASRRARGAWWEARWHNYATATAADDTLGRGKSSVVGARLEGEVERFLALAAVLPLSRQHLGHLDGYTAACEVRLLQWRAAAATAATWSASAARHVDVNALPTGLPENAGADHMQRLRQRQALLHEESRLCGVRAWAAQSALVRFAGVWPSAAPRARLFNACLLTVQGRSVDARTAFFRASQALRDAPSAPPSFTRTHGSEEEKEEAEVTSFVPGLGRRQRGAWSGAATPSDRASRYERGLLFLHRGLFLESTTTPFVKEGLQHQSLFPRVRQFLHGTGGLPRLPRDVGAGLALDSPRDAIGLSERLRASAMAGGDARVGNDASGLDFNGGMAIAIAKARVAHIRDVNLQAAVALFAEVGAAPEMTRAMAAMAAAAAEGGVAASASTIAAAFAHRLRTTSS